MARRQPRTSAFAVAFTSPAQPLRHTSNVVKTIPNFCCASVESADKFCKLARVIGPRIGAADRAHLDAGMEAGARGTFSKT